MRTLNELRQARATAIDELQKLTGDAAAFDAKEAEISALDGEIERAVKAQERAASLSRPAGSEAAVDEVADVAASRAVSLFQAREVQSPMARGFDSYLRASRAELREAGAFKPADMKYRSLGEQLQDVFKHYATKGTQTDTRLVRAPTGAGEVDPTGGGFLVQTDFANAIFMLSHDMGEILGRVNKIPISANANGLKIPGVDESSRATGSRWGGVQSNWAAEGVAGTESRPKFRMVEFDLRKLISKMTVTDELLADSTALSAIAGQAFSEEVMFMTEDAIFEGTGAGQPLGIINSPALVTVAKENGQGNGTIQLENINKMWARLWARSRKEAVWLINQDCEPQLYQLNQVAGIGGQPVYIPPGGVQNAPNSTLFGRPVIATEYSSILGAPGDIALVDLSQYTIVDKGGVNFATSMHVAFDTDEMRFRITYRVDGKPMWHQPITPFKGSNTRSPFVVLAQR